MTTSTFKPLFFVLLSAFIFGSNPIYCQGLSWAKSKNVSSSHSTVCLSLKHSNTSQAIYSCGTYWPMALVSGVGMQTGPIMGYIAKYDSSGGVIWTRNVTSTATVSGSAFSPTCMAVDNADNVYVAGYYSIGAGNSFSLSGNTYTGAAAFILKFDSAGTLIRNSAIPYGYAKLLDMDLDAGANLYILGSCRTAWSYASATLPAPVSGPYTTRDFVISCDSAGNGLWAQPLGNYDMNFNSGAGSSSDKSGMQRIAVDKTGSGSIYICGMFNINYSFQSQSFNIAGTTKEDALLFKLNRGGIYQAGFSYGGTNADVLNAIDINRFGKIVLGGYFYTSTSINGSAYTTTSGWPMSYVARLDTSLGYEWLHPTGIMNATPTSVVIDDYKRVAFATRQQSLSNSPFLLFYDSSGANVFTQNSTVTSGSTAGLNANGLCFSRANAEVLYFTGSYKPAVNFGGGQSITASTTFTFEVPVLKFSLPPQNSSLPVELLSFSIQSDQTDMILSWQTATELNNQGFGVERSENGKEFTEVDFVRGKGNMFTTTRYKWRDVAAKHLGPHLYYRLKQVDFDGQLHFSNMCEWIEPDAANIQVWPNPAEDVLFIRGMGDGQTVQLFDMLGREVSVLTETDGKRVMLNTQMLSPGLYTLRSDAGETVRLRIH